MNPSSKLLGVGFFKCDHCEARWYDIDVKRGERQICNCGQNVQEHLVRNMVIGLFNCRDCNRQWRSVRTYANTYQKCANCLKPVMPHIMKPLYYRKKDHRKATLDIEEEEEEEPPHRMDLCGRCIRLEYRCCPSEPRRRKKRTKKTGKGQEVEPINDLIKAFDNWAI